MAQFAENPKPERASSEVKCTNIFGPVEITSITWLFGSPPIKEVKLASDGDKPLMKVNINSKTK